MAFQLPFTFAKQPHMPLLKFTVRIRFRIGNVSDILGAEARVVGARWGGVIVRGNRDGRNEIGVRDCAARFPRSGA